MKNSIITKKKKVKNSITLVRINLKLFLLKDLILRESKNKDWSLLNIN